MLGAHAVDTSALTDHLKLFQESSSTEVLHMVIDRLHDLILVFVSAPWDGSAYNALINTAIAWIGMSEDVFVGIYIWTQASC